LKSVPVSINMAGGSGRPNERESSMAETGTARRSPSGYSRVAIALHWIIAALIVGNVIGALTFDALLESADPADKQLGYGLIQLHKSVGLTVLILSLVRLTWRLLHGFPRLPEHMAGWEIVLARGTHVFFYAAMIGVPLLGWALVSASPANFPIDYFGLFEWPQLPLADSAALADGLSEAHETFAFATVAVLLLHVAGALKHHFLDRDDVLARMLPLVKPRS